MNLFPLLRRLDEHGHGRFYARQGIDVTTPVDTFPAYLDEESILIGRFAGGQDRQSAKRRPCR